MARSDVPAHEGPTHHAVTELWTYDFPLTEAEEQRLVADLSVIPPLMRQAQQNLTGNARELWIAGIRNIRSQRTHLDEISRRVADALEPHRLCTYLCELAAAPSAHFDNALRRRVQ